MADEEYEHIPWSELREDRSASWPRLAWLGVALLVGVVVGVVFGGGLRPGSETAGTDAPEAPVVGSMDSAAAVVETSEPPPPAEASEELPVLPPGLYREADLLAVMPEEESRLAATQAEWFVTDHFTVDGVGEDSAGAQAGLGVDGEAQPVGAGPEPATYVEWARAFRVDGSVPGRYVVDVAYRLLVETGDGSFVRTHVRAARVPIVRDAGGVLGVGDLPSPTSPPSLGEAPQREPAVDLPPDVEAAAARLLAGYGLTGRIVSGSAEASGWRVVVDAGGDGVPPFPMVVEVPGS